ncbi:MAG: type II toxin-antitoxin system RelE/ParE family toxin [Patescibacteria group bacterium]
MRYRVVIPKKVQKKLDTIDGVYRDRIVAALAGLQENPYRGTKLYGKRGEEWSCSVWPSRIVYRIEHEKVVILIIKKGHRPDVSQ